MLASRTAAALAAAALLLTGCAGGDDDDPTVSAPGTTGTSTAPGASAPAVAAGATLPALVGTKDSPEAFEISLTDASGNDVTSLPAGTYTIQVTDESAIHNFALKGEGVDMKTDVSGKESPTWTVDLKAGDYTFVCDPHPSMSGSFTVT